MNYKKNKKKEFESHSFLSDPEYIPSAIEEKTYFQNQNINFWENNPMRYDWNKKLNLKEGSEEFFKEIDRRFFDHFKKIYKWNKNPFDNFIDFETLKDKKVLEIGIGSGSIAAILAKNCKNYKGIDITKYAVQLTSQRLKKFNNVEVLKMDAENITFDNNSFDFIWSWGVIHHSSDTDKILKEIARILKPNGEAFFMVYYRGWWNYYFSGIILHGIFRLKFLKYKTLTSIMQSETDGALARYYTIRNWKKKFIDIGFSFKKIMISGNETDYLPIPGGKIKNFINNIIPASLKIFLLSKLKMGSFLISHVKKNL